jgi:hypothetical protein
MWLRIRNEDRDVRKMRLLTTSFGLATFCLTSVAANGPSFLPFFKPPFKFPKQPAKDDACTLTASGGDDAPHFLKAVHDCATVTIPAKSTLSIQTRMNMTGLRSKHIVSRSVS